MLQTRWSANLLLTIFVYLLVISHVESKRRFDRRNDSPNPIPLSKTGWTVPLQGGLTCRSPSSCTQSLPGPPASTMLTYLTIGRGTITYTCAGQPDQGQPVYVQQQASLYDVSSLIPKFSSESQFHSYIPSFLRYDYTALDNSSLTCIGNIQTIDSFTIFDIFNVAAFPAKAIETINAPSDQDYNVDWVHTQDDGDKWDVYRVETAGGQPPYNCGGDIINDEFPVEYVAEYWFYAS